MTRYADGGVEQRDANSVEELCALLCERVTEDGNPRNLAGIAKVVVQADAPLLQAGIVMIDTPGIGSTFPGSFRRSSSNSRRKSVPLLPRCFANIRKKASG